MQLHSTARFHQHAPEHMPKNQALGLKLPAHQSPADRLLATRIPISAIWDDGGLHDARGQLGKLRLLLTSVCR